MDCRSAHHPQQPEHASQTPSDWFIWRNCMAQPRRWLDEVIDALDDLHGEGNLQDIYEQIRRRGFMDFSANPFWQDRVRETLQRHSLDSEVGQAYIKNADQAIFIAPKGKGAGYWAIRGYARAVEDVQMIEGQDTRPPKDSTGIEGAVVLRYVSTYERKPGLRAAAILFHGTTCKGCGLNFEAVYGSFGSGFIEVHHLRPVSQLSGATLVSCETDMTVLCANCHRMVHHQRDRVLSLEELRALVDQAKNKGRAP